MSDAFETASPEQRPHLLRSVTDPAAAAHFASQRHSTDWQPCFDVCVPALETCALLMMVKNKLTSSDKTWTITIAWAFVVFSASSPFGMGSHGYPLLG